MTNFWNQLETQQISKNQVEEFLLSKLGQPNNSTQTNLLKEIIKKIKAYYFTAEPENNTIFSLTGTIVKADHILEKKQKEGRRKGQTYYVLKITTAEGTEQLQAREQDLDPAKFSQIQKSALLAKNLVFKYKIWITNKQIIDFYPLAKKPKLKNLERLKNSEQSQGLENLKRSHKAETG